MSAQPATFNDFLGNSTAVEHLRTAIAAGKLPHSLILAGPAGAGKYTLALMLAMAVECERQPRDLWSNGQSLASFCGVCRNCTRIATASNLEDEVDKAVAIREEMTSATDKKDTRVLIQPHPDVLIIPLSLAVEEARDVNVGHSGSVRIGFVSTAAPRLIPELLHRLRRKYPLRSLEVLLGARRSKRIAEGRPLRFPIPLLQMRSVQSNICKP
jgi:DNA polymerase III delta prime subunit